MEPNSSTIVVGQSTQQVLKVHQGQQTNVAVGNNPNPSIGGANLQNSKDIRIGTSKQEM